MSDLVVSSLEQVASSQQASAFSFMLKKWRKLKRYSQLDLAMDAGVSQRHLSFLESGRSVPSRAMVLTLARALTMPLREQNALLNAAGFSSTFQERQLNSADMLAVNQAVEMMLAHHDPFPAIVVDRNWNLLSKNTAAQNLVSLLGAPDQVWQMVDPSGNNNIYRLTFHPNGFRSLIRNWAELSIWLLTRLQQEVSADPCNTFLSDLYEECLANAADTQVCIEVSLAPVLPMELCVGDRVLKTFSMISSLGTAQDVTAEELKIETFYPADDVTRDFFSKV